MAQHSPLGMRMKSYEATTDMRLPAKSWAVLRLDGKAFHSYTRDLVRPFDQLFMQDMTLTMKYLCESVGNAVFGYTQSDEISILIHDLARENHQLWFGGKIQKIVSVAASMAGAYFNASRSADVDNLAVFDARVFALPNVAEVKAYLLWRQMDAERNALFMAASEFYSHKELLGKTKQEKISMLQEVGQDWTDSYSHREKFGAMCRKVASVQPVSYTRKDTGETLTTEAERSFWIVNQAVPFKAHWDSPGFSFLNPEEPICPPNQFSLLGHTSASTPGSTSTFSQSSQSFA